MQLLWGFLVEKGEKARAWIQGIRYRGGSGLLLAPSVQEGGEETTDQGWRKGSQKP